MRGIMTEPMAAESATAEPETEPNMVQAETVTTPSPPGMKASSERAKCDQAPSDAAMRHQLARQDEERDRGEMERLDAAR